MSRYEQFDLSKIRRYSLEERKSKVSVDRFGQPLESDSLSDFLDSLPGCLAADDLRFLVQAIRDARDRDRSIIWGFGGHVIKVGLAPVLIDLMREGFVTCFATNGSGVIHDFEIALSGSTSEDVDAELKSGAFGMAEETAALLNKAISHGVREELGLGESVGRHLDGSRSRFPESSLILQAYRQSIPVTVHLGIGTDIIHLHPEAVGADLGEASHTDFKILTEQVSRMNRGGVYLNLGSAVILPEVFLKTVTVVRSSGMELENFTTANLDFIQHYRPRENVVRRPVLQSGKGVALTGHHEILIPLLAALLKQ